METLNSIELSVYNECKELAKRGDEGYEFVFLELCDETKLKLSKNQMKGYISQLVQKGYLITFEGCYFTHGIKELY